MAATETDPLDATAAGTPLWWAARLQARLDADRPELKRYRDYYAGRHRLLFASLRFRQAFGWLFQDLADDWCALVVDAAAERLEVQGFRAAGSEDTDAAAWETWQRSRLDARAPVAHTEAIKSGRCYVLAGPPPEGEDRAVMTVESPLNAIVESDPANPDRRLAALKRWRDVDGSWRMTVYLPGGVFRFAADAGAAGAPPDGMASWHPLTGEDWAVANPAGVVPMVPMLNNPDLRGDGISDLRKVIPLQDAANKLLADLLVASEFASFRQRWATGIEIPRDDDGNPINVDLRMAVNRLLTVENPDARFGEFEASDLGNYVKAIEMLVQHIAAQTRTPPHYLLGQSGAFPSGESLKSTETGLVAKVRRKMLDFGDAWEEAIRVARALEPGGAYTRDDAIETVWADPESRTEGEHVDAVLKKKALGVPQAALWEELGYSPSQIARFRELQAEQAALLGLTAPVADNPELAPQAAATSTAGMAAALTAALGPDAGNGGQEPPAA